MSFARDGETCNVQPAEVLFYKCARVCMSLIVGGDKENDAAAARGDRDGGDGVADRRTGCVVAEGSGSVAVEVDGRGVVGGGGGEAAMSPTKGGMQADPTYAAAGKLLKLAKVVVRQHTPSATIDIMYS